MNYIFNLFSNTFSSEDGFSQENTSLKNKNEKMITNPTQTWQEEKQNLMELTSDFLVKNFSKYENFYQAVTCHSDVESFLRKALNWEEMPKNIDAKDAKKLLSNVEGLIIKFSNPEFCEEHGYQYLGYAEGLFVSLNNLVSAAYSEHVGIICSPRKWMDYLNDLIEKNK